MWPFALDAPQRGQGWRGLKGLSKCLWLSRLLGWAYSAKAGVAGGGFMGQRVPPWLLWVITSLRETSGRCVLFLFADAALSWALAGTRRASPCPYYPLPPSCPLLPPPGSKGSLGAPLTWASSAVGRGLCPMLQAWALVCHWRSEGPVVTAGASEAARLASVLPIALL